jgi:pimeloyl-ACP methyl ester carboxylesterase
MKLKIRSIRSRHVALGVLAAVLAGYAAFVATFAVKQEAWIHAAPRERPTGLPPGLEGRELRIAVGRDGARLAAWWLPAGEDAPAVLYLLGVGHTLADETETLRVLRGFGVSVLAPEYRGFGLSDAAFANERTMYEDGDAAWRKLAELAPRSSRLSIYGHSLGGAVAIEVASRRPEVAALVLESTFTSMQEVLQQSRIMRMLPLGLVLSQRYLSEERIAGLAMPKVFIHGTDDIFVPPRMSEALIRSASPPKALVLVPRAGHSDALTGSAEAREAARRLLTGRP